MYRGFRPRVVTNTAAFKKLYKIATSKDKQINNQRKYAGIFEPNLKEYLSANVKIFSVCNCILGMQLGNLFYMGKSAIKTLYLQAQYTADSKPDKFNKELVSSLKSVLTNKKVFQADTQETNKVFISYGMVQPKVRGIYNMNDQGGKEFLNAVFDFLVLNFFTLANEIFMNMLKEYNELRPDSEIPGLLEQIKQQYDGYINAMSENDRLHLIPPTPILESITNCIEVKPWTPEYMYYYGSWASHTAKPIENNIKFIEEHQELMNVIM